MQNCFKSARLATPVRADLKQFCIPPQRRQDCSISHYMPGPPSAPLRSLTLLKQRIWFGSTKVEIWFKAALPWEKINFLL
ncbi:MAG: hypothetical protein DRP87_07290 [Spirochaetes bacterium]|nr:MAG: hypothetical protein DRP87_07290 [Spirochaetota bacterium]